ncbi:MAG: YbaB/EbfC family nucleoid-associated protein [Bacteroidales bacterium]
MIGDLFSKLQEARTKIEESKKKLNTLIVEMESENRGVSVKANANKFVTSIEFQDSFLKETPKDKIEEIVLETINKALEEAARKGEIEIKEITKDMLPNFPGLV